MLSESYTSIYSNLENNQLHPNEHLLILLEREEGIYSIIICFQGNDELSNSISHHNLMSSCHFESDTLRKDLKYQSLSSPPYRTQANDTQDENEYLELELK